jgi:hypothetical protein
VARGAAGRVIQITFANAFPEFSSRNTFGRGFAMKRFDVRFCYVIVLMVLSSSAYAGQTFSFMVGRHRVRIEAPRHCHSTSCLSVSIPEIRETCRGGGESTCGSGTEAGSTMARWC